MIPPNTIPPELPPSVEEAYRAKCIQLRQRLNEIEEANDNARTRITRIYRGIQKSRLERAFLLEQLAKRTSANVEDSEGSPSPPPTPKEKPLRSKRGHRKPDFMNAETGDGRSENSFSRQGQATMSPSSDTLSHTHSNPLLKATPQAHQQFSKRQLSSNEALTANTLNRVESPSHNKLLKGAFEIYCNETRPRLLNEHRKEIADGLCDIEVSLTRSWSNLDASIRNEYIHMYEQANKSGSRDRPTNEDGTRRKLNESLAVEEGEDEDIELPDRNATPVAIPEISGFTPVNRT